MQRPICATMKPRVRNPLYPAPVKLGGPRYVCGKPANHDGSHGDWMLVGQAEHAELLEKKQRGVLRT